jgi:diacylglycerol kinase family enzyme
MVMIANTPLVGLKNLIAPDASMEDGLLDVAVYPGFSKADLLAYFARTMGMSSAADDKVQRYRARKIKIKTSPAQDIAAEGMVMGQGTAKIKVLPGVLQVISPQAGTGAEKVLAAQDQRLQFPAPLSVEAGETG